ncbi:halocyanin domain-containing protein [Halomicroarcula sp. GCM10025817]|uniref:halocyanin domain-containing protein n=1 Tax=Haloarcula TaxID=2237 RepID=UPI0023E828A3|nr:halocyanin domain-containing protein [Halomicroarcula sp. SYNS111]
MRAPSTRRQFLACTALAGLGATAGCLSTDGTASASDDGPDQTDSATPDSTTTPPSDLETWLADATGYDGDRARYGPGDQPTVAVGEPFGDDYAFYPAVVEVTPMTRVRWEWTGHGGQHNVVALDGPFDSGRTNAQSGTSYDYIFDETGVYPYVSEPRRDEGMRGAVVVREPPTTGYPAVDEWLASVGNFDGTVTDRTDAETTTVTTGAEGNGGHFAFTPPVLKIETGTTVRWEWTGNGGGHNVAFEDADIESGDVLPEPGVHFEHTFESSGSYLYSCLPHKALGMRGAVVVE